LSRVDVLSLIEWKAEKFLNALEKVEHTLGRRENATLVRISTGSRELGCNKISALREENLHLASKRTIIL